MKSRLHFGGDNILGIFVTDASYCLQHHRT